MCHRIVLPPNRVIRHIRYGAAESCFGEHVYIRYVAAESCFGVLPPNHVRRIPVKLGRQSLLTRHLPPNRRQSLLIKSIPLASSTTYLYCSRKNPIESWFYNMSKSFRASEEYRAASTMQLLNPKQPVVT
jgi:hypothetical protein